LVTMGASLEHVHDPRAVVGAAARALRPGGWLVVSVPNYASWQRRTFGPDWWGLELPLHLLHFTPRTLARLAEAEGLTVLEVSLLSRPSWLRRSLRDYRQRAGLGLSRRLLAGIASWTPLTRALSRGAVRRGQGDCLKLIACRSGAAAARRAA